MAATDTKKPSRRKPSSAERKTTGWALGTTAPHYWLVTALADRAGTSRLQMLEAIIDHYIDTVLAKASRPE